MLILLHIFMAVAIVAAFIIVVVRDARARYALKVLARMGHDLRTPLAVLAGIADALRDPAAGAPGGASSKADVIARQVRRMTALVDGSVGAAARAGRGGRRSRGPGSTEPCVVARVDGVLEPGFVPIVRALDDIDAAARGTAPRRVALRVSAAGVEGLFCRAYDERFFYIASNLVKNALEHGVPNVRPILRPWEVRLTVTRDGNGMLRLIVEDEGPGFAMSPLTHEPRSLAPSAPGRLREARRNGGLGLFIVRELVAEAGGSIDFESPYAVEGGAAGGKRVRRHGCRVTVELPVAREEEEPCREGH